MARNKADPFGSEKSDVSIMRDLVKLDDVGARTLKLRRTRSTAIFGARESGLCRARFMAMSKCD